MVAVVGAPDGELTGSLARYAACAAFSGVSVITGEGFLCGIWWW
jgi:hypothetical protein